MSSQEIQEKYAAFRDQNLKGRYLTYEALARSLDQLRSFFEIKKIGNSACGIPINMVSAGEGELKILAWSQMHGNESTTTKAVMDILNFFRIFQEDGYSRSILENVQIRFIPMLNPDGAKAYTRVNANGADLNRDAQKLEEIESRALREVYQDFKPDYCFNLHDQRTIFSAGAKPLPATISFLTPAMDKERTVTPERAASMRVIVAMNRYLQHCIPGMVGRYSDDYNINCTGDTFQTLGVPTILFEAGHYYNDYQRERVREFMVLALFAGIKAIATQETIDLDYKDYFDIPQNEKLFFDIILRSAVVGGNTVDLALQFKEELLNDEIEFLPYVEKIDPDLPFFGHKEIDCKEMELKHEDGRELHENDIAHNLLLKNEVLFIK